MPTQAPMSKQKKKALKILAASADQRKLGKKLTIGELRRDYVMPELESNNRSKSTRTCLERETRRFEDWWATLSSKRLPIKKITRKHLELFREWMAAQGRSVPARNAACRSVMQCLNTAYRHGMIKQAPKLEALRHRGVAPKVYPSDDEICKLWDCCKIATWPKRDRDLSALGYDAATAWRVAIILYRLYGFRTQELIQLEQGFTALAWSNVFQPGLTPNPEGRGECDHGWISYVPQKQKRNKSEPLVVPLTKHARAALDRVIPKVIDRNRCVMYLPLSAISFRKQWRAICEAAEVAPRAGSGVDHYMIKHFRKGATSEINRHRRGLAPYIVGHAQDRSGNASLVSSKHYDNSEAAVLECMETLPVPACFDEILSA